jgi:hypothetical protein
MAERNTVRSGPLLATLQLPTRSLVAGQTFPAVVTVRNTGSVPVRITANSGSLVYVRVMRHSPAGFFEVKRYPPVSLAVVRPWELRPGEVRRFEMTLTAEPDWPTNEPLRLEAEVNGQPALAPGIIVQVSRGN